MNQPITEAGKNQQSMKNDGKLQTIGNQVGGTANRFNTRDGKEKPRCWICNSPNHLKPQCPQFTGNTQNRQNPPSSQIHACCVDPNTTTHNDESETNLKSACVAHCVAIKSDISGYNNVNMVIDGSSSENKSLNESFTLDVDNVVDLQSTWFSDLLSAVESHNNVDNLSSRVSAEFCGRSLPAARSVTSADDQVVDSSIFDGDSAETKINGCCHVNMPVVESVQPTEVVVQICDLNYIDVVVDGAKQTHYKAMCDSGAMMPIMKCAVIADMDARSIGQIKLQGIFDDGVIADLVPLNVKIFSDKDENNRSLMPIVFAVVKCLNAKCDIILPEIVVQELSSYSKPFINTHMADETSGVHTTNDVEFEVGDSEENVDYSNDDDDQLKSQNIDYTP